MPILKLKARQILDSRGDPTIEVDLCIEIGLIRSSVPSFIEPNEFAAKELRDEDKSKYNGLSVFKAVNVINNTIAPELLKAKLDVNQQKEIDMWLQALDGTPDKSKLGANATLAVSISICKAAAAKRGLPLYKYIALLLGLEVKVFSIPVPFFDVINGGLGIPNNMPYRGFYIIPTGAQNFAEAMQMGRNIYKKLEEQLAGLEEMQPPLTVTYKGGFAPNFEEASEAIDAINEAIKAAGYEDKVKIGFDVAAYSFYEQEKYNLDFKTEDSDPDSGLESEEFQETIKELLIENSNIISVEDPFGNDDTESWSTLLSEQPGVQVVADNLVSMNEDKLEETIENAAANCLLVKLGQAGTVTEALQRVHRARQAGWGVCVCTGPGETEDNFVADFSVGICAGQIKAGAPCQSGTMPKYNQILRIEEELGVWGRYAGEKFFNPNTDELPECK